MDEPVSVVVEVTPQAETPATTTTETPAATLELAQTVGRTEAQTEQLAQAQAETEQKTEDVAQQLKWLREEVTDLRTQMHQQPKVIAESIAEVEPVAVVPVVVDETPQTEQATPKAPKGWFRKLLLG